MAIILGQSTHIPTINGLRMKTMKHYVIPVLLVATSLPAFAQEVPVLEAQAQVETPKPFGIESITPEQELRIMSIQSTLQAQIQDQRPNLDTVEKERAQWEAIIQADEFDTEQAKGLLQAYNETQMVVQIMNLQAEHDIYQVLTPEQKATLAQLRQDQKDQMEMMMEEAQDEITMGE